VVERLNRALGRPAVRRLHRHSAEGLAVGPGDHLLDVGCGLGSVALQLGEQAGPEGRVLGVDASRLMVEEATRRATSEGRPATFVVGDALRLDLPDGAFDVCRSERTLQWLDDPVRAVSEMARVLRPGGRLGLIDTDWGTLCIDHPDPAGTERLVGGATLSIPNPRSGRRLLGQLRAGGFEDLRWAAETAVFAAWDPDAGPVPGLPPFGLLLDATCRSGAATEAEADAWLAQLEDAARAGHFFLSVTLFSVTGRKPA
jgi:SAM-dependent methyltransferase